jgi:UDP-N-acetylmuramoylalanine--D-glutamate ligase
MDHTHLSAQAAQAAGHFTDKRILLWGYGREGKSTERFLREYSHPAQITVFEGKPEELTQERIAACDYIIKSPGIPYFSESEKLTSQTEIFLQAFREQTIGVTGTKGKSTTSSMLASVLGACTGRRTLLMGNIGLPCLDYFGEMEEDTIAVMELSCHQLANARTAPHIGVFLNLYEEHLDYYHTLDAYFAAKAHIARCQKAGDFFYCGENVPEIECASERTVIKPDPARETPGMKLYGAHNQLNALFVRTIAERHFGCPSDAVTQALQDFEALPHRMHPVGRYGGLDWYDDSISTIPEAAIQAASSIPGVETLLIGGMDRGIHYGILEDFICAHPELQFVCMYATGARIARELEERGALPANVHITEDLKQAVEKAAQITAPGRGVALSPAAASYGYFKNFEERGDAFAELVKKL